MKSRCREIIKLADNTYNQYKISGDIVKKAVLKSLETLIEFIKVDCLLSQKETSDMITYVTYYINIIQKE